MTVTTTRLTAGQLTQLAATPDRPVPCNGCRECCRGDMISLKLHLGDKVEDYRCHQEVNPVTNHLDWVLDHKPNGDCVYLGATGCTIHDRAPVVCREFDCRLVFKALTRNQRREWVKNGAIKQSVFDAARKRLDTL